MSLGSIKPAVPRSWTPVGSSPAESAAFHRKELDKFKRAVELSGATME